jgi:chorismate dehydratase
MNGSVDLTLDYPAAIAQKLVNQQIDIGLVPVAILPQINPHYIISNYGIACNGEVASVCLFSDVPIEKIETILLDYQSKTSVQLLKILLKEYWKINPKIEQATPNYEADIKGNTAGLVIGDRAFAQRLLSPYIYDLGTAWKALTGLPFVFAAWVSNKKMDENFITQFNEACRCGFNYLDEIIKLNAIDSYDLKTYYQKNIDYTIDDEKIKAVELFLSKIT